MSESQSRPSDELVPREQKMGSVKFEHLRRSYHSVVEANARKAEGDRDTRRERELEIKLVRIAQNKSEPRHEAAFRVLQELHYQSVRKYIFNKVREDDAGDVIKKTWLKTEHYLASHDPEQCPFRIIVRGQARDEIHRHYTKYRHGNQAALEDHILKFSELIADPDNPDASERSDISPIWGKTTRPEILDLVRTYLLPTAFTRCGYPWQLIAFGYSDLLGWKPAEIVINYQEGGCSGKPLLLLEQDMEPDIRNEYGVSDLDGCFGNLRRDLTKAVGDLAKDGETRKQVADFADCETGYTFLDHYYGHDSQGDNDNRCDNISNWTYRVRKNIRDQAIMDGMYFARRDRKTQQKGR